MENIPVRFEVVFVFSAGTGKHEQRFSVSSEGGVGVLNPLEHASAESFEADCLHTTRRWCRELGAAIRGDLAEQLAPRLAAAVCASAEQMAS